MSRLVRTCPATYAAWAVSARFVHLHIHSEYSLVDSTIRIPRLVERCAALGQPAVAVTDRNNLFSLVEFHATAEAAGVKPLAGADVMVASGSEPAFPVTLLCRNRDGYLNLSRLLTRAWLEGHRNDGVVVRPDWLKAHAGDLFALVGRHTEAGRLAATGKHELALGWLADLQGAFDDGRFARPDDLAALFPPGEPNGDGLVPATLTGDPDLQKAIADIISCLGPQKDRSGEPAVSEPGINDFFAQALAASTTLSAGTTSWSASAANPVAATMSVGSTISTPVSSAVLR